MRRLHLTQGIILGVSLGLAIGVGAYTFVYAQGYSYLTDNPAACANCHIMNEHYSAWLKSSHRHVAVCNDCHTPPQFVGKYMTKARNGFWHSYYFTTGWLEDNIRISDHGFAGTEKAQAATPPRLRRHRISSAGRSSIWTSSSPNTRTVFTRRRKPLEFSASRSTLRAKASWLCAEGLDAEV